MSEKCPVCENAVNENAARCDNCGFEDKLGINREWLNVEDGNRWTDTVVKPYRAVWETRKQKEELLAQLEAAKQKETELLTQLEAAKDTKTKQDNLIIPKMFADITLENEKARIGKQISDTERSKINFNESLNQAKNDLYSAENFLNQTRIQRDKYSSEQQQKMRDAEFTASLGREGYQGIYDGMRSVVAKMLQYVNPWDDAVKEDQGKVSQIQSRIYSLNSSIAECERKLVTYKTQLKDVENLLHKTALQRTENHYQRLLDAKNSNPGKEKLLVLQKQFGEMEGYKDTATLKDECFNLAQKQDYDKIVRAKNSASTEDEYRDVARQFRGMNGYGNTAELARECESTALKVQYDRLVRAKNNASDESEYQDLVKQFMGMSGYKNTSSLASECVSMALKVQYDRLVRTKNNASNESEFQDLAGRFREMNGYEDTAELANDCDSQYLTLKAQAKREQEERERREEQEKKDAERRESMRLIKKIVSFIILIIAVATVVGYFVIQHNRKVSIYEIATVALSRGDYEFAIENFQKLGNFRDAGEKLVDAKKKLLPITVIAEVSEKLGRTVSWQKLVNGVLSNVIGSSYSHTMSLRADGTVVSVGSNKHGQLDVSEWKDIVAVSARVGGDQCIGLRADGTVVAVGDNGYGQCNVTGWKNIVAVSAGSRHTVGLMANGTVVAVGSNEHGQCNVTNWKNIVAVSAASQHTIGLRADGTVVAVGSNEYGMCNVSDLKGIVAVSGGWRHTVALRADGTLAAVGYNEYGQCNVSGVKDIIAISAGRNHTVVLRADGTVAAGGYNKHGQCNVSSLKNVVAISAGGSHTVALQADGTIAAVGSNEHGQSNVSNWKIDWPQIAVDQANRIR
jgi:alpha-tubulin suppressor-like RCC1 family protein